MTANAIPSPIYVDGIAYLMSGFRGNMFQAVRLEGAKGDLAGSGNVLWTHDRETSYTPSALIYGDFIYFISSNNGRLSCLDKMTGEVHYERQQLQMRTLYSSPVGAAGRVYLTSREGSTKVIKLGAEYEEIATNQLDDGFDATMAVIGDAIYLRGRENLYCIAETDRD
jgi:outer membrane protein assembly factor BamB